MGYKTLKTLFFLVVLSEAHTRSTSLSTSLRDFITFEPGFVVISKNKKPSRKIPNNAAVTYESSNLAN